MNTPLLQRDQVITFSNAQLEWCWRYFLLLISALKAREPTRHELAALHRCMSKMKTAYTDEYEHYLVDLYVKAGLASARQQYVRKGDIWKDLGFQNHDPASDIRGGGILCLENMLFFIHQHRHAAQSMIKKRATGWDTYETFPWAPASINITRLVAAEFFICGPGPAGSQAMASKKPKDSFPAKSSFHMLLEEDGFGRIYVLAFLLLDKFWDEKNATYMEFNSILDTVRSELSYAIALSATLPELEERIFRRVEYLPPPPVESWSVQDECQYSTQLPADDTTTIYCIHPPLARETLRFRHKANEITAA
mmetsp:Transcript_6163/g.10076  ORF Transcript_6163/g.10076 Transcript_6163/m.10076 type:complete len:308 (+) Transcript_6163:122-1045(+)|eukprot:CAMPEP_0114425850 /NCGR_PEP_ID=MMETSP0103-20121206/7461_1 /TAXON_ID=37642 ORGANISM="Paraphysomonas imperforata, Strain PA2" /NCGR_SAMPLE_ID=MMETSP0103 /ASSEMBLY_ACC=CAM_ASM_000201 /LENGTH=307 /DNA_ID=CAMNT_0001594725 /DNA_START=114 /DNA_END=1037 /DNA_ORIENTATION=-